MTVLAALESVAAHPATFGIGVGIANGVLAEGRNLPLTTRSAVITALVLAAGEMALAAELPNRKLALVEIGAYSLVGVLVGLWPFVGATDTKSLVQSVAGRPALITA